MAPVSSPTAIICSTTGVNTPVAMAARRMVSPRSTASRMASIFRAMWALSTVWATTDSACSIGTPLFSASEKLRANRDNVAFCTIGPASGARSFSRSQVRRPAGWAFQCRSMKYPATPSSPTSQP